MQRFALISLLLCVFGSSGCMIIDELDAAGEKMDGLSKTKAKTAPQADGSDSMASKALKTKDELLEQSKQWWDQATSLSPTAVDSQIVTCRLDGEIKFMSKDDCLVGGGVPKSASG